MSGTFTVPSVMSCTLSVISYTNTSGFHTVPPSSVISRTTPLCFIVLTPSLFSVISRTTPLCFIVLTPSLFSVISRTTPLCFIVLTPSLFSAISRTTPLCFIVLTPSLFSVISRIAPHCFMFSVLTSSVYMYVTMYKRRKSEQLSMQTIIFDKV